MALTTFYISIFLCVKHRKMADFNPQGAKTPVPILMKLGMVDYVRHLSQPNITILDL